MGIFSRLFGNSGEMGKDPFYEQVNKLVPSANTLAISSLVGFLDRHKKLSDVSPGDWDFFVTVAALSCALMGLSDAVSSEERYNKLTGLLSQRIKEWNPTAEYAMSDLMMILQKVWANGRHLSDEEATKLLAACLGSWCMANLKKPVPRETPDALAMELGMFIIVAFRNWWAVKV
jgi:hypothetical protein